MLFIYTRKDAYSKGRFRHPWITARLLKMLVFSPEFDLSKAWLPLSASMWHKCINLNRLVTGQSRGRKIYIQHLQRPAEDQPQAEATADLCDTVRGISATSLCSLSVSLNGSAAFAHFSRGEQVHMRWHAQQPALLTSSIYISILKTAC